MSKYPHMRTAEEVARRRAVSRMAGDPAFQRLTEEQRQQAARNFPEIGGKVEREILPR